jgi:hypothetical protein
VRAQVAGDLPGPSPPAQLADALVFKDRSSIDGVLQTFMGRLEMLDPRAERRNPQTPARRARRRQLLSADCEYDSREVDRRAVVREELGESPGGQPGRANGVRMSCRADDEGDRQLVGAGGLRAVPVIPAAEVAAEPVVDDGAQFLNSVKHLPGRVPALATQRDARTVPRP